MPSDVGDLSQGILIFSRPLLQLSKRWSPSPSKHICNSGEWICFSHTCLRVQVRISYYLSVITQANSRTWSLLVGVKTWELKSVNTAPSLTYSRTDYVYQAQGEGAGWDQSTGSGGRLPGLNCLCILLALWCWQVPQFPSVRWETDNSIQPPHQAAVSI